MTLQERKVFWGRLLVNRWNSQGILGHSDFNARFNYWLYRAKTRALLRAFRQTRISLGGAKVLDVGTGMGFWLRWYRERGAGEVAGVDISEEAICRLRTEFPGTRLWVQDVTKSFDGQERFDLVHAMDVLYHIPDAKEFEAALRNLGGAIRPGGWLVVSDRLGDEDSPVSSHVWFRSLQTYKKILDSLGCEIQVVQPACAFSNGGILDGLVHHRKLRQLARKFEQLAAPLLYWIDGAVEPSRLTSLRILVAQKTDIGWSGS